MSDRPGFLTVAYGGSGLQTLDYEKKMVREKDVKFDGEDGSLELTDVRLVWYKAPKKQSGLKKFGALAGAIAGAALLEGAGRQMGGIGGHALRSVGRGIGYAAVGTAVSSWTRDSYLNKDANGNTESIALPLVAIAQATQSGSRLIVELKAGGNMQFDFKQKNVIPSVVANVNTAHDQGKCPYCGTGAGNSVSCPKCGAPLGGTGGGTGGGSGQVTASRGGRGSGHIDVKSTGGGGSGSMRITYSEDADGDGQPDSVHIDYSGMGEGGGGSAGGYCSNCGQPYPEGAKFCNGCGHKVG
ncbi:zinc ribbon domain-containing protein [Candidatus Thorarchaeota archaeon]|nr:MAG: zinc ribbon domain-containing protein [Candidatus Thorarchaeota archaeon]